MTDWITPKITATFVVRWILGVLFVMAGYWKVFELGATGHAQQYFVGNFADTWIPAWLLWTLGVTIPFVELAAGLMLIAGLKISLALTVLGLLLIVTTYGHALQQPLFDIDGHTFTRLALIVFLLMAGSEGDRSTADYWITRPDKQIDYS